ncbi:MAG: hypothetical protein JWO77_3151 [Ilumatobacteraceae bacterium]|nr:hypothetical protein [Ilumatobacteraceae bacterium]
MPWTAIAIVLCTLLVLGAVGGGAAVVVKHRKPTRSVEAFCSTMKSEQKRILEQFESVSDEAKATGDEFAEMMLTAMGGVQAMGELQTYFAKLAKVAPAEIQTEAELVAEKIGESMKVPELSIEGIAGSMINGIALSGPLNTLNAYAKKNCGQGI